MGSSKWQSYEATAEDKVLQKKKKKQKTRKTPEKKTNEEKANESIRKCQERGLH